MDWVSTSAVLVHGSQQTGVNVSKCAFLDAGLMFRWSAKMNLCLIEP